MTVLKTKEIRKMNAKEREEKLKELKMELVKKYTTSNKSSKLRQKEIKKAIARILTLKHVQK